MKLSHSVLQLPKGDVEGLNPYAVAHVQLAATLINIPSRRIAVSPNHNIQGLTKLSCSRHPTFLRFTNDFTGDMTFGPLGIGKYQRTGFYGGEYQIGALPNPLLSHSLPT